MATDLRQNRVFGVQTRTSSARTRQRAARSAGSPSGSATEPRVSGDQIAQRAYEIWQSRGCPNGQDVEHWLEAERQLRQRA